MSLIREYFELRRCRWFVRRSGGKPDAQRRDDQTGVNRRERGIRHGPGRNLGGAAALWSAFPIPIRISQSHFNKRIVINFRPGKKC